MTLADRDTRHYRVQILFGRTWDNFGRPHKTPERADDACDAAFEFFRGTRSVRTVRQFTRVKSMRRKQRNP